ncbi:MAG: DUF308 domain-containing protein [Prevotellaceae bacterium]|nr:DUF308 domain-containing protein [Prevotellaceae bacterium]
MKTFSSKNTWIVLLICAAVLVAISIAAFINSGRVLGLLIYVAGFALCGLGIAQGIAAFLPAYKDEQPRLLTLATSNALLGIFVMIFSQFALIFVGIAFALGGAGIVLKAVRRKKDEGKSRLAESLLGVTCFVLGWVVVVFHNPIRQLVGEAFSLLLLIAGLSLGIIALLARRENQGVEN